MAKSWYHCQVQSDAAVRISVYNGDTFLYSYVLDVVYFGRNTMVITAEPGESEQYSMYPRGVLRRREDGLWTCNLVGFYTDPLDGAYAVPRDWLIHPKVVQTITGDGPVRMDEPGSPKINPPKDPTFYGGN